MWKHNALYKFRNLFLIEQEEASNNGDLCDYMNQFYT